MSQEISANNRRIAKNTLALYVRSLITMVVGLYTGRVMLQALGVENYGIQAVVGGIVGMTSLITGAMSGAISRYITFALGQGDKQRLATTFSTAINAQIILALAMALLLEVGGVWFLNNGANIPAGRMFAANCVLQFGVVSLMLGLVQSPYGAVIVAHERMSIYAYTTISDAVLKLAVCFIIQAYDGDRLILLSILNLGIGFMMQLFYQWYCRRHFEEAHYHPRVLDRRLLKELTVFSGWNLFNHGAWIFSTQGVSMLVNVFFGVVYNASRSVALTVNGAVQGLVGNFTVAFSPQITKSYAAGDYDYAMSLANRGTKFTWLLMYLFIVPVCMEAETLLDLWLGQAPPMSALFLRLAMFESLAVSSGSNLLKLILADGRLQNYSVQTAVYVGMIFPVTWLLFHFGAPVWSAYVVFIFIFFTLNVIRFINLKRLMPFSVRVHLREVVLPCTVVSVLSFVVPVCVSRQMEQGLLRFFVVEAVSVAWTAVCSFYIGLTKGERSFFVEKAKLALQKFFRKEK